MSKKHLSHIKQASNEQPEVASYYLRKCRDNMWQAMRIKDGKHEPLHVEDTLGIALNTLMNTARNDVVPR